MFLPQYTTSSEPRSLTIINRPLLVSGSPNVNAVDNLDNAADRSIHHLDNRIGVKTLLSAHLDFLVHFNLSDDELTQSIHIFIHIST